MVDTGWLDLSSFSNINSGSSGADAWTNPGNAVSSDDTDAQVICGAPCGFTTQWLSAQNLSQPIPGSVINGIELRIEASGTLTGSGGVSLVNSAVIKGGVVQETTLILPSPVLTGTDAYMSAGGATELWGLSWSASDINASNFGIAVYATGNNSTFGVVSVDADHMQVKIYYTVLSGLFLTL